MTGPGLQLDLPAELIERIAERAAAIIAYSGDSPEQADGYLDVDGAAGFLSCPKSRIYALVSSRRVPFHKDGSRLLFDRAELRAFVLEGGAKRQ